MTHARNERDALCATLVDVGPDAPTLCAGWDTRLLAAHLVVREHRPDSQIAGLVGPFKGHADSVQAGAAERPWADLLQTMRAGPPAWHWAQLPVVDEATNLAEFYVHHEDVLRAQPSWTPRPLADELERALWRALGSVGRLALRRSPVGVELVSPGHGRLVARRGHPLVRVEGTPGELLLFAFGRREVARVHLDGPNEAVARLTGTPSGL